MKNKIYYFLLIVVLLVGFFLRFYKLGNVPLGFYQDESAIGYNAYSVMLTGKDEHGISFPLYFKSFGDYKLPVYIYATIPAIKLFGMTEFAVRFPSAIFGFLTLLASYFFIWEITRKRIIALITVGFLAINPWSLHYNRATFEVSITLFFFVVGALLLHSSFQRKKTWTLFLGTLCFIISLYSYNLTRLLSPLLYLLCIFSFSKKRTITKKEIIITAIGSFLALIPFVITLFGKGGFASAGGTLIFSSAVVKAPLIEMRSYLVGSPFVISHFLLNIPTQLVWQYVQNLTEYLSVSFFFISGSSHGNHGIGNFGQFYLFELPLFVAGIVFCIKEKYPWRYFILGWIILTIAVAALTRDIPQATRSFFLIIPVELLSAVGLVHLWNYFMSIKNKRLTISLILIGIVFISYDVLFYFTSYYGRFPTLYAEAWRQQDKQLSSYVKENQGKYNKIIFDSHAGFVYSSLLFFQKYPPLQFQKTVVWQSDDSEGMSFPTSFDKYEFRPVNWAVDSKSPKTLIITSSDSKPENIPAIATFSYPSRPIVIAVKQEIISYPSQKIAYEVVETK